MTDIDKQDDLAIQVKVVETTPEGAVLEIYFRSEHHLNYVDQIFVANGRKVNVLDNQSENSGIIVSVPKIFGQVDFSKVEREKEVDDE